MPDGYAKQQVAEFELFQLRQQLITATSAYEHRHDEMMRHSIAYQQQHLELSERVLSLERDNENYQHREGGLSQEAIVTPTYQAGHTCVSGVATRNHPAMPSRMSSGRTLTSCAT